MIGYAWRTGFGAAEESELREMLAEAADADAEAGFPRVSLDQPYLADASHLVVRLLPDERAGRDAPAASPLAAYLRVEPDPDGGPATARYVVRPAFRSRGISTLLLERLGLDLRAPGGWAGTGVPAVRIWARGDHPAAERIADRFERFGVQTARKQWQLLAPLRPDGQLGPDGRPGPDRRPARPIADAAEQAAVADLWCRCAGLPELPGHAEVLVTGVGSGVSGAAWFDPQAGERTEYGTAGLIIAVLAAGPDGAAIRAELLSAAMAGLRDRGLRVAAIAVDTQDYALARSCRLLGFRHDRTDTEYILSEVPRR
jgi:mycothiol synthase